MIKMKKNAYYIMETTPGGYREAKKIHATSLTAAKRAASRGQVFYGTELLIGLSVDENGFVRKPIAVKHVGGEWVDIYEWENI